MSDNSDIREICADVELSRASNWMNINDVVLNNARTRLAVEKEEIILFYDLFFIICLIILIKE